MKKIVLLIILFVSLGLFPLALQAQVNKTTGEKIMGQVGASAEKAEIGAPADFRVVVTRTIKTLLETVGAVFIILIVYGGYTFITAEGEEEKVTKGLNIIKPAIIGLVIILAAYGITLYVGIRFTQAVTEGATIMR